MAYFKKYVINMVCRRKYGNRSYIESDARALAAYHYKVYDAVIAANDRLLKKPLKIVTKKDDRFLLPKDTTLLNEARKLISSVNRTYGRVLNEVSLKNRGTITKVIKLDVTPFADQIIDRQKREDNNEIDANEYISDEGDVLPYDTNDKRVLPADTNIINQELADKQANLMENKFSALGVNTFISYDADMNESGKLLGTNDPIYSQLLSDNKLVKGTAIIVVNPNKLYSDTVFHEFGHLFIELLGGMNNARIKAASDQLIGTTIEKEVSEAYPNLSGDNLRKEIISTALGKEAAAIFDGSTQISWWKRFVTWFKNLINRELGVPKDAVLSLASELVTEKESLLTNLLPIDTQFQKDKNTKFEKATIIKRRLNTLTNVREQIYSIIRSQLNELPKDEQLSEGNILYKGQLEQLQNQLNKLEDTENSTAVLAYLQMVDNNLSNIQDVLNEKEFKYNSNHSNMIKVLASFKEVVASFSLVADIQDSVNKQFLDNDEEYVSVEDKKLVQDLVADLSARYVSTQNKIVAMSTAHLARLMSVISNRSIVARKDELEIEFNKNNKKSDNESKQEYVNRRNEHIESVIEDERDSLREKEYENIFKLLNHSPADVSWLASWLNDGKSVNSIVIQLVEKFLDDADTQRDGNLLIMQNKAAKAFKELKKSSSGTDPKKLYKGLYETGSDGNLYYSSRYSVEFYIKYRKLSEIETATELEFGNNSKEHKKAFKNVNDFLNDNLKNGIPIAKWLNLNYNTIKNNEVYKFLIDISFEGNNKTEGLNSNIKSFDTQAMTIKWHKAPNIGKKGFEQIASGNIMENLYESLKRTISAKRADETEFGSQDLDLISRQDELQIEIDKRIKAGESADDLADEINSLIKITNSVGDLKSNIPIFFRGQHNLKDQSYDLISIALMDYAMAENYYQKNKIKDVLELTLAVTNNKQVAQTEGALKKTMVQMLGKNVYEEVKQKVGIESNEAKMLASIIENRLYGVKTIKKEYAQIANSLMAWSATTMLAFNHLAAAPNVIQGKVFNFIEAHGGQYYNKKDLVKGEAKYWASMKGILDDVGKPVQRGKTNQMMNLFSIQGEFKVMSTRFNEDNRFKSLLSKSSLFFMNHLGEHYIHGTMMYSILNNIKIKNKEGQFINSRGEVVSKEKAMTLDEAFSVGEDGNLKLNKYVYKTSFGNQKLSLDLTNDKGILEVRNLINKIANDMHGQYNDEYQSMFQRRVVGKMVGMLRKWIVPGFNRRWRGSNRAFKKKDLLRKDIDVFFSEDLQTFQEGYYTSFIRFINTLVQDFKRLGLQGAWSGGMDNLTTHEKANLRKTVMELSMIVLSFVSSMFIYKQLDGLDEDDEEAMMYLAFFSRRLYSELSFFANPLETFQILRSPAASISYTEDIIRFLSQIVSDGTNLELEIYQRGKNKGLPKAWKRGIDLLPIANQMGKTPKESLSYLLNTN